MAGSASISGLMSGLKTDEIIAKMLEFGQRPINLLRNRQAEYTKKLTAWQEFNTRLLALKVKATSLKQPSAFEAKTVSLNCADTSLPETYLTASAYPSASSGVYFITVNRLAQAEQRQSQAYSDTDITAVGTGTITVGLGESTKEITIDSSNNTLAGLRDAINRANAGVSASIVDYGSGTNHAYRLLLTSSKTGADNAITWTSSLSGGTEPTWTTTVIAQDSQVIIGSGETATTIEKSGNSITDVFNGLYLTLRQADPSKQFKVTVSPDPSAVKDKVKQFIEQYNSVIEFINKQFDFDPDTLQSGVLFGDYSLQNIQQDLRSRILSVVDGLPSTLSTLSQIGLTSNVNDKLVLDESKLDKALADNPLGVMKLFTEYGEATNQGISYISSTGDTVATGSNPAYRVRIDRAALQARVTAGVAQTENLVADETLTINGTDIRLTAGMSLDTVVEEINKYTPTTRVTASRTLIDGTGTGDFLTLKQNAYGAQYTITAISSLSNGGATPVHNTSGIGNRSVTQMSYAGEAGTGTGNAGADVAGAFGVIVNGITTWEDATGSGQYLTGDDGNKNTDGLKIKATVTSAGEYGTVSLTRGVSSAIDRFLAFLTSEDGSVNTSQDTLNKQIEDLNEEITEKNERLTRYEEKLRFQFADLESNLGKLQSQGAYISAQLAALNKSSK